MLTTLGRCREPFDLRNAIDRLDQVAAEQGIELPDFDRFGRDLEKDKNETDTLRTVTVDRIALARYRATNVRGDTIEIGEGGNALSAVELLLAAMACCSAADVDYITSKRSEPEIFSVEARGDKIRDEQGNRLINLGVDFKIDFPRGNSGERARAVLPRAVEQTRDRLCTVSRTIALPNDLTFRIPPPGETADYQSAGALDPPIPVGVEAGIDPTASEELGMGASLHQATMVEHEDFVGGLRSGKSMGNGDRGSPGGEKLDRSAQRHLEIWIDRGGRLVEDQ